MLRRLFPAIIAVTFPWALAGCPGFNHYEYHQPPPKTKEAEKWWADNEKWWADKVKGKYTDRFRIFGVEGQ